MIKFAEKKIYSFLSTNNRSDPFPILCALARSEEDWRGAGKEREETWKKEGKWTNSRVVFVHHRKILEKSG